MHRCRKPPIFAFAYISPARSSKRRISSIFFRISSQVSLSGSECLCCSTPVSSGFRTRVLSFVATQANVTRGRSASKRSVAGAHAESVAGWSLFPTDPEVDLKTRNRRAARWTLLAAAAALCVAIPSLSDARSVSLRFPTSGDFADPCLPEPLFFHYTGTIHVSGDENGAHAHSKLMGKGTDANGERFIFTAINNSNQDLNLDAPGAKVFNFVAKVTVNPLSKGPKTDDIVENIHE